MGASSERRISAGLTLILVGLGLFLLQRYQGLGGSVVLLVLGSAFLLGYFLRRVYGFLVPAGVLLGLGAGQMLEASPRFDQPTLLGLGCGFVAIYLISLLYERRNIWWPLIPGGILILIALESTRDAAEFLFENWPLILVVIGILVLIGAIGRLREEPERDSEKDAAEP